MKDVPTQELAAISPEIYEAAERVGCTHVSITGEIWPGGQLSGPPEEAARFVEFSWCRAAAINGRAIFEDNDPKAYAALLNIYGLGDEPYPEPTRETPEPQPEPTPRTAPETPAATPARIDLTAQVLPATRRELERQASADGLSIGELLDWKFQPPPPRPR